MAIKNIEEQLRRDEGEVLYEYKDHLGYSTIGIGRLIDKRKGGGITKEESAYLFRNDVQKKLHELTSKLSWFLTLDQVRQGVLLNMSFQMGVEGLLKFKNTLALIEARQFEKGGKAMLQSKWAKQTPERAKRLSDQMITGRWQ